ncbi:hypothetical protein GOC69_30310, partial [Sinorhizobium medicae]|nr:hypothetical protein [Sinorhizobium medicae]MDX0476086.1 hypothetical protein [Sinorhizobium medicae]
FLRMIHAENERSFEAALRGMAYPLTFFPRLRQIEAAHALVEEGVDLILGAHPHVIQPVEYYRTKRDPNRIAVIAYSLGTLTWGWYTAPHLILSLIMHLKLAKGHVGGEPRTYIESAKPNPVVPLRRRPSVLTC